MATKTNAPVQTLAQRKAELDAAFHAGTKSERSALMYANGLRKAREDKGYGRAAVAKALGITAAEWWVTEFVLVAGSPEHKVMAAKVAALPSLKKDKTPAVKSTGKAPAASKATAKDLI